MLMPTIVFDIDGVLCREGGFLDYSRVVPYADGVDAVNRCYDMGCRVVLQTARGMWRYGGDVVRITAELYPLTYDWLTRHGVRFHELHFGKRSADLYVDDRGCRVESAKGLADWGKNFWPAIKHLTGGKMDTWYEVLGVEEGFSELALLMKFPDHETALQAARNAEENGVTQVVVREAKG